MEKEAGNIRQRIRLIDDQLAALAKMPPELSDANKQQISAERGHYLIERACLVTALRLERQRQRPVDPSF